MIKFQARAERGMRGRHDRATAQEPRGVKKKSREKKNHAGVKKKLN
jgi:hypothetical protein